MTAVTFPVCALSSVFAILSGIGSSAGVVRKNNVAGLAWRDWMVYSVCAVVTA